MPFGITRSTYTNLRPYLSIPNLVLAVDAGDTASYPGTGTTWTDLSGNNNNGSFVGSITFQNVNGGVLQTSNNSYINFPTPNLASGASTVIGVARYSGSLRQRIIAAKSNNWLLGHWSNGATYHYAEGWVTASSGGTNDTNWRFYAATGNTATDTWAFYINDTLQVSNNAGSAGPNGFSVGAYAGSSEYSDGQVGILLAYNRVLSTSEMTTIFNWCRGRYGL